MALPKVIEQQGERADELQRQLASGNLAKEGEPAGEGKTQTVTEAPVIQADTHPLKKEEPAPVLDPPKVDNPPEDFKQKYLALKGKYDTEIRRLHGENAQMSSEIARLKAESEVLKTSLNKPEDVAGLKEKLEKLKDEYGGEFTATIQGLIDTKVKEGLQSFEHQLKSVETKQVQSASERFFSYLDANISNWESVNNDPEFLAWLSNKEPFSGKTFRDLLVEARDGFDPAKAANIFKTYAAMTGAGHLKAEEEKKGKETEQGLEKLLAPGKSEAPASKPQTKKTYTRQDVASFFNDVAAGKYKGRETEQQAIEADIFLAQQEGRIL